MCIRHLMNPQQEHEINHSPVIVCCVIHPQPVVFLLMMMLDSSNRKGCSPGSRAPMNHPTSSQNYETLTVLYLFTCDKHGTFKWSEFIYIYRSLIIGLFWRCINWIQHGEHLLHVIIITAQLLVILQWLQWLFIVSSCRWSKMKIKYIIIM